MPTSGSLLILSRARKRMGSPRRQGLCSHLAHTSATFHFVPRTEVEGIPEAAPEKARVRQPLLFFFVHPPDGSVATRAVPHL